MAEHLRQQIVCGELHPGEAFPPEKEVVAQLGVSKPTLREALRVLENEGLLMVERGVYGGARVREPSTTVVADYLGLLFHYHGASIGDIVRTRVLIQFEAARRFAERASDADLEALEQVLDSEAALFGDQLAFRSRSLTFQLELTDRCGDAVLMVLGQVLDHIQRTIMNHIAASLHPELPTAEIPRDRQRLVAILRTGAADAAAHFWRAHQEQRPVYLPDFADDHHYDFWDPEGKKRRAS